MNAGVTTSPGSRCTSRRGSRAEAGPDEVLVSRTVCDVVAGSGLDLESRGEFDVEGRAPAWELFAVQP